ncbi:C2 membrane targeting protein [Penicillium argentinense]|uniref:C2 membrane targeting protein n=1 Tax=Penicillium argentinense TaxID=1131581 RepID=A0A9W9K1H0_9EURO|nr:C2 membrane targeting protein [Penicillium argentinense]KAJ5089624.1 C2 membrane targeting protein [Penicillium argentinense]
MAPPNDKLTESPQQHRVGEHWSGTNPVPTVQKFIEHLDQEKKERDRRIDEESKQKKERDQKLKEHDEEGTQGDVSAHKAREVSQAKVRMVTDPTTGREIGVEDQDETSMDAVKDPKLTVPNANLGRPTEVQTSHDQEFSEYKENQDITAPPDPIAEGTTSDVPIRGEKTNVLFHPTPTVSYQPMFDQLEKRAMTLCIAIPFAIIVLGRTFGGSLLGLIPLAACIASGVWLWVQQVIKSGKEMEWSSEQLRGQTATANLLPESVEWMNSFLAVVWGLVNPDMLVPMADTIEDIMQASAPSVVENVRIAEIDQGNNPFRILSMRALPDEHVTDLKENIHKENVENKDPQEAAAAEEGGSYYNMEASFAYHAKPSGSTASSKASNMHMQIVFYLGIRGLFGVPFPVFVELTELVGTVRLRLQMTPEPPFAKELTFSLVGIPHVKAGCVPMLRRGVNVLNLPLISNFVNYAIGTACAMFAAPKSMTMDLSMMLKGDDIHKDTLAIGVMWVRIHRAVGLSKQDRRGSEGGGSDPYINLSFSKYGKPMYCTRVITDDLNPIWEETAALLVSPELIKANENLSVELWDSDRNTADDIVGKVELPIREMLQHPSRMYPQVSRLQGLNEGSEMPGQLHWEVGYFGKPKLRRELRTDGKKKDLPENLKGDPTFEDEKGTINNEEEDAVMHTPPDPIWPSGIIHIVVHQIVNLQLQNIKGSDGNRKGKEYEPAKPFGENTEEQGGDLPTSYCKILLNDQLIYRTRPKAVSSKPIFNAGTERFVRDWRSAVVTVTVRDQRYREHDPVLGVVPIKLSDIFQTSSQVTRWYPLDGGIGFGRIRISLLFRHVETKLPPTMLGWDVGTFEFLASKVVAKNYGRQAKIKLRTGGSIGKITRHMCKLEGSDTVYDVSDETYRDSLRMPVKHRYRSPVVFEFHNQGKRNAAAYAVLWLQHLVDNEDTDIDIPIWTTKAGPRLTQNYVTEKNWKAKEVPGLEDLTEVGRLQFRCKFSPGIDESHEQFVVDNDSRETFETWEACMSQGVRSRTVEKEVPEEVQQKHELSLIDSRDVLKQADPAERRRWIDREGHDWSGAFGHDPRAYTDSDGQKVAEPGRDAPAHDPVTPPPLEGQPAHASRPQNGEQAVPEEDNQNESSDSEVESEARTSSSYGPSTISPTAEASSSRSNVKQTKESNKRSDQRQQRGLMQWRPARNAVFARDEVKFGLSKMKKKLGVGGLTGREPDVETET